MALEASEIRARRGSERRAIALSRPIRRGILAAVVLGPIAGFYAILNGNGWVFDDNLSFELAKRSGFSWAWLRSDLFGHFEPAHRAVFSLLAQLMPIDARVGLVAQLALLGAAIFLLERSLRMVVGGDWVPLAGATYLGFSFLLVPQLEWLSSGLEAIPMVMLDLLALWAFLRFQRERRLRWAIVCGAAVALGLTFYEKPLFMVLYLVLIRIVLLPGRLRWRAVLRALAADWPIWLALLVAGAAYIAVREASGSGSIASGGTASLSDWISLARVTWVDTLAPAMFGLRLQSSGLSSIQIAAATACQVALLVAVIVSVRRNRYAWRAWAVLLVCVLQTIIVIGAGRLADFGPGAGGDTRYLTEFVWLTPFIAALAWRGPIGVDQPPAQPRTRRRIVVAGALVVAYVLANVLGSLKLQTEWPGAQARQWEQNVEASLAAVAERGRPVTVAESAVPLYIVEAAFAPNNQLSYVLPLYGPQVHMAGPLVGQLMTVTDSGRLRRAAFGNPIARTPPLTDRCGTSGANRTTVSWTWAARVVPSTASAYLRITYKSTGQDRAPIYLNHVGSGYFGAPDEVAELYAPYQTTIAWLGTNPTRGVKLNLIPGTGVCVKRFAVLQLVSR